MVVVVVVVVLSVLLGTPAMAQRTPWLAPKGTQLSRAAMLRERLHHPVVGPEDNLPAERGTAGKE